MENNKIYTIDEIRNIIQNNKKNFEEKYFVDNFMLFGSYAKNQSDEYSDIDLLVSFKKPVDMFEFMDLQEYLTNLFRKKVDLGTPNSLKKFIKEKILKDALAL